MRNVSERNRLVMENLRVADSVANTSCRRLGANDGFADPDDIRQEAAIGLIDAASRYEPSIGVPFNRFALHRARGATVDYLRRLDFLARSHRAKVRAAVQKRNKVAQEQDGFDNGYSAVCVRSLDEVELHQRFTLAEMLASNDECPSDSPERADFLEWLMRGLIPYWRTIILLYYFENLSMMEIGRRLGKSEAAISIAHRKIMNSFREKLASCSEVL